MSSTSEGAPAGARFDVCVRDLETGRILDVMRGYRTVVLRELQPNERFELESARRPGPNRMRVDTAEVRTILRRDPTAAEERYLSASERVRFHTLHFDKRQVEWLAGRIAAKRLIREAIFERDNQVVPFPDITLQRDALGAPVVDVAELGQVRGQGVGAGQLRVSMSHSGPMAVAFLSTASEWRPGIDIERIEERDPSWARTYFTVAEQADAGRQAHGNVARALTETWAVKEATLKALGIGARVDFVDVEALRCTGGGWSVTFYGQALERARALGAATSEVEVEVEAVSDIVEARVLLRTTRQPEAESEMIFRTGLSLQAGSSLSAAQSENKPEPGARTSAQRSTEVQV